MHCIRSLRVLLEFIVSASVKYARFVLVGFKRIPVTFKGCCHFESLLTSVGRTLWYRLCSHCTFVLSQTIPNCATGIHFTTIQITYFQLHFTINQITYLQLHLQTSHNYPASSLPLWECLY